MAETIKLLTPNEFRQMLAGLEDDSKTLSTFEYENLENEAINFMIIMLMLYNQDRLKIWERIPNVIIASANKTKNKSIFDFVSLCIENIGSEIGRAVQNEKYIQFLNMLKTRPIEWHSEFVKFLITQKNIYPVFARSKWEQVKKEMKLEKERGFTNED